ncbi:MAG: hypothetical protein HY042_02175 [Spirochaetia bacterium]|nr:hypothetical protein [Spirochaetia bacterium]
MAAFFAKRQDAFSHPVYSYPAKAWYLDPDAPGTLAEVTQTVTAVVNDKSPELLARYFGVMQGTKESYAQGITAHFFQKLRMLYAERDLHGKPLYGRDSPAIRRQSLSFPHWTSLALRESDVDFLVTNTALAGPDTGMPLYVINRGGVTTAFVENNKFRPYQAVGVFALYPFLSTGEYFQKERGVFPRAQLLDAGAVLFVHELGHLLLRKAENYTLDGSVFRAPRDLRYVEWAREVKAKHKTLKDDVPAITRY